MVILESLQKECEEIKSKTETSKDAGIIIQVRDLVSNCRDGKEASLSGLGNLK